jgi:hypothetical protein
MAWPRDEGDGGGGYLEDGQESSKESSKVLWIILCKHEDTSHSKMPKESKHEDDDVDQSPHRGGDRVQDNVELRNPREHL